MIPIFIVAAAGLVLGSFLDRCVRRLGLEKSILWPVSCHCAACYQPTPWRRSLPVVGPILFGGACPTCGKPLPRRWTIEWVTALLVTAVFILHVGMQGRLLPFVIPYPWSFDDKHLWALFVYHSLFFSFLIVATFIDLEWMIIPDSVTFPGMVVGVLLGTFWFVELHPVHLGIPTSDVVNLFPGGHWHMNWNRYLGAATSLAGLIVGGAWVWIVRAVCSAVFGREAMGTGDITLMAMIGSFLGWQTTILAFFVSLLPALFVGMTGWLFTRRDALPFGPHLSLGAILCVFFWQPLWAWGRQFFAFEAHLQFAAFGILVVLLGVSAAMTQALKRLWGAWTQEAR